MLVEPSFAQKLLGEVETDIVKVALKPITKTVGLILIGIAIGLGVEFFKPFLPHLQDYLRPPLDILNISAEEFVTWYVKIENEIEAEELAKSRYYGKFVRWTGTVQYPTSNSGVLRINWGIQTQVEINSEQKAKNPHASPSYHGATISAAFKNKRDTDRLSMPSSKGKKITVLCRLSSVDLRIFPRMTVILDECQLEELNK